MPSDEKNFPPKILEGKEPVHDLDLEEVRSLSDLISQFKKSGGFTASSLAKGIDILREMINDRECERWLSFIGAIIATGARGIIANFLDKGLFKYVVTTCGALDHDIARSMESYYSGEFGINDKKLVRESVHRVGSVLVPQKSYGLAIEKFMQQTLEELYSLGIKEIGSADLCRYIGERINDESSFLRKAYEKNVMVFVPGIMDGAVGTQLWLFHQRHRDFKLNLFKDFDILAEITFKTKRSGALILGGGISKHHLIWWAQFSGGLDYAVQITTAVEYDGSLSGASLSEAISWKKVKPEGKHVTIYGDVTVILPLIAAALLT